MTSKIETILKEAGLLEEKRTLHLDNTFSTKQEWFPEQRVAYDNLSRLIRAHPNDVFTIFTYSLGKEEVLLSLA